MKQCANLLTFSYLALTASISFCTTRVEEPYYLDPRHLVPFCHLFLTPGSSEGLALRFINDIMISETPKMCDVIGFKNDSRPKDPTPKFDVICIKLNSVRPAAIIGIQPLRFESTSRKITQYEVADHYVEQLEGFEKLDWEKRLLAFRNLVPVLSILVSHFEPDRMDRLVKHSKMLDTWSYDHLYKGFAVTTMYLDKCRERVQRDSDVMRDNLDKWCHFFTYANSYRVGEIPAWTKTDDAMKSAYSRLDPRKYTEEEIKLHNETLKAFETTLADYKKAVEEGRWKPGQLK
ncbi:uncharacterized protein [Bemisia tabaci]|uniref:uncharacterized protein isoform X1 n=2 Tax=Bemisia tabaci TaxID=7038 RepID=UPI003B27D8E7